MVLRIILLLLNAYLLLGVLPWVLARSLHWYLTAGAGSIPRLEHGLERLRQALDAHLPAVRETPRPGPFAEPDRKIASLVPRLRAQVLQADALLSSLHGYGEPAPDWRQIVFFGGIDALRGLWPLFRVAWNTRKALLAAEETHDEILDQVNLIGDIPRQVEAQIEALQAEHQRLLAVLDEEREVGTRGLEGLRQRLQELATTLDSAQRYLRQAPDESLPTVLEELKAVVDSIGSSMQELDERVQQVVAQRQAVEQKLQRAASAVGLLAERWEGLRARGAKDLKVSHQIHALGSHLRTLDGHAKLQTVESLQTLATSFESFERQLEDASGRLDFLDGLLSEGHERLREAADALARADHRLQGLQRDHPDVVADQATASLDAAREHARRAEQEFAKGTEEELARAAEMAGAAGDQAAAALSAIEALPKVGRQMRELCDAVAPEVITEKSHTLDELQTALSEYPQHWEDGLVAQAGEARSLLKACVEERQRLPRELVQDQVLLQSQVATVQDVLARAVERLNAASDLITGLERQRDRVLAQRDEVERRTEAIRAKLVPEIELVRERLLPELAQRYDALQPALTGQLRALEDPRQTHYGHAISRDLPALERQLFELREAHQESVRHYRDLLKRAVQDSEGQWTRLQRLDPLQVPRPDADLEELAQDMRAWREEATANEENPRVLQELVGRRAAALLRRIEAVTAEIEQGRATLASLDERYEETKTAVLQFRTAIHERGHQGDWEGIHWETEMADGAWQRAQELEREASQSSTLPHAVNAMQRAVTAAREAVRLYGDLESEMDRALKRLDREWQIAANKLGRAERRQRHLEERKQDGDAREVSALCASARRAMDLARAAATFDDAFRHLRDAHNHLAKL